MISKEDLALQIALAREPSPSWKSGNRDGRDAKSDGGSWWIEEHHIGTPYEDSNRHARPLDGALAFELLQEMVSWMDWPLVQMRIRAEMWKLPKSPYGQYLKEAIAYAWLQWKGLKL